MHLVTRANFTGLCVYQ